MRKHSRPAISRSSAVVEAVRWTIAVLFTLALVIPTLMMNVQGGKLLVVAGASMEPALSVGDLLLVSDVTASTPLKVGDVVVFVGTDGYYVTHRIVAIGTSGEITTRGDANEIVDPTTLTHATISGIVQGTMPEPVARIFLALVDWPSRTLLMLAIVGVLAPVILGTFQRREMSRNPVASGALPREG